jgi:UDP-N-acetylglucosamine transferase subunit ALG13
MILVTVGTSSFDDLITYIDNYYDMFAEEFIVQIGSGKYIPKHIRWFRYIKSLDLLYEKCSCCISCGGAATLFECMRKNIPCVAVENTTIKDRHQQELINKLSEKGSIVKVETFEQIPLAVELAKAGPIVQPSQITTYKLIMDCLRGDKEFERMPLH